MDYYKQTIYIPKVNKDDKIIGKVERWQAHKEKILHRGFTTILKYQDQFILQHRKHPVFNDLFDLSFSSHPVYFDDEKLQTMEQAIINTFQREWLIKEKDLQIKFLNKYYYQEADKKSGYFEHEINYLYLINLKTLPKNNPKYSYGMKTITFDSLKKNFNKINFAPWVKKINLSLLSTNQK